MSRRVSYVAVALATAVAGLVLTTPAVQAASTGVAAPQTGRIVSDEPATNAPNILDGKVYSITQVGNMIVVGGTFTQVQNYNTSVTLTRNHVMAFDATTGKVSTTFNPSPNGTVFKVQAAADGRSVYVGGRFTSAGGRATKNLFEADVASGAVSTRFVPSNLDAEVRDIEVVGSRLFVAGKFTHIASKAQKGLGTLNATTGKYDPFFTLQLRGLHNPAKKGSVTDVLQISTNAANTELVAVGNFTTVSGAARSQIAKFDISGTTAALSPWNTNLYTQACSSSFDTYMTDVEYSPNGSYFVVSSTGAYGSGSMTGTSGCDVVARFEDGSTSSAATPSWTAYTGGDTTWTVEVTDKVVYTGGHMRWQNNPNAADTPAQGAVSRPGIAALDPVNGLPYSWNPTRARGEGVLDMLATDQGLYVGSDTTLIGHTAGNTYHARIALLPFDGGKGFRSIGAYSLPSDVYTVASGGSQLVRRTFDGSKVTSSGAGPTGLSWGTSVGAFMINGTLYTGYSNGTFTKQSFDGSTFGPATAVATGDALTYQKDWHTGDLPAMTSLFYSKGRIYFTRTGRSVLYNRAFEPEDDLMGQLRLSTGAAPGGPSYLSMHGAFVAGGNLYYSDQNGRLFRVRWSGDAPTGTPVQVSGPGKDALNWASRVVFPYQGVPNTPPTAAATGSCDGLTCTFDGSGSTDPDGSLVAYAWDFGDGSEHATGVSASHTFATAGDQKVTLTVTDDRGGTAGVTTTVSPTATPTAITFVDGTSAASGSTMPIKVTVPGTVQEGDTMLLAFSAAGPKLAYTPPADWTEVQNQNSNDVAGRVWEKVATAADAGTTVSVTASNTVKSTLSLLVYRGVDATSPVTAAATAVDDTATSTHTTPVVDAPDGSNWLISVWADKSSSTTGWTGPSGQSQRAQTIGSGAGYITSLVTDSDRPVGSGPRGGLTATPTTASGDSSTKGMSMSLLLKSS